MPRPARLSRDGIVQAATALVAEEGLAALTMRSLARRLGADPMAVYRHVRDKDDLLGAMCDALLSDLPTPEEAPGWRPQLRGWAVRLHDRLAASPALVPVLAAAPITPTALALAREVLERLREAGFSPELAAGAVDAVFSHLIGSAVVSSASASVGEPAPEDDDDPAAALLSQPGDFELGLDLLLDGIEARVRE